jgi:hypothetical protein
MLNITTQKQIVLVPSEKKLTELEHTTNLGLHTEYAVYQVSKS